VNLLRGKEIWPPKDGGGDIVLFLIMILIFCYVMWGVNREK